MAGKKPERIHAILEQVLKDVGQRHTALFAIQHDWRKLVGKRLAAHTKPVSLRKGRLVVQASRPGESFTLSYQRAELLERLRAATEGRVEEIVIRPGGGEAA